MLLSQAPVISHFTHQVKAPRLLSLGHTGLLRRAMGDIVDF